MLIVNVGERGQREETCAGCECGKGVRQKEHVPDVNVGERGQTEGTCTGCEWGERGQIEGTCAGCECGGKGSDRRNMCWM